MKKKQILNKIASTFAFAGIVIAGFPRIANAAIDANNLNLNVCRQTKDSQVYRITFEHNGQTILVEGDKDSGGRLDRGGVKTKLVNNYDFSQTDGNYIRDKLDEDGYDIKIGNIDICTIDQLNIGTIVDTTSIKVCRPSENDVYYRITLDHDGKTLMVDGEKDSGKKLDRGGVKQNLINNYNFSESDGQVVKDILIPDDILLSNTALCGALDPNVQLENVSTELVLSVDVSVSVNSSEFDLQVDGYVAAFNDAEVQQAIKNLPEGLAVTMQFWAEGEVIDIGWFKLIENGAGGIDNLTEFIAAIEGVSRSDDGRKITVGSRTADTGGGTDIALAINSAKNLLLSNTYAGDSLVIDVSGDGVSDDTPYTGVNEENGDCPHDHFCPPLEAARDAAVAEGITINGLPIVNNQNVDQLTHEIDIHYETLVVGGPNSFVEVANDFSGFTTAAKNKILREISGEDPDDSPSSISLTGTIRDFQASHPDFEFNLDDSDNVWYQDSMEYDTEIVTDTIGSDKKPVYNGIAGNPSTSGESNFNQWYNDVDGVNQRKELSIVLEKQTDGTYQYSTDSFFPLNNELYGNVVDDPNIVAPTIQNTNSENRWMVGEWNSGKKNNNYHFTYEIHNSFTYQGGETFTFEGDDDVWVYINGKRVIDVGGVHSAQTQTVDLDAVASSLGLVIGGTYDFDFFFAERNFSGSNFTITTTIELEPETPGDPNPDPNPNPDPDPDPNLDPNPNPNPNPDEDSDADNNGITDANESARDGNLTADLDNDGVPNYQDLDDDGDNIADVMELYSPSELDSSDTKEMTHTLRDGSTIQVTLPNPPKDDEGKIIDILHADAVESGDADTIKDYQDTDSDGDTIEDKDEAGDIDLATAPFNEDSNSDTIPNYLDLDSDGDTISDADEAGDSDSSTPPVNTYGSDKPDYLDLDSDDDNISDADEAGDDDLNTAPLNSFGNDNPDYLDTDSDDDNISDADEAGDNDLNTAPRNTDYSWANGTDYPDYLDLDSDEDGIDDIEEAGDDNLETAPYNSDNINDGSHSNATTPSGFPAYDDETPDFIDLDSDNNGIEDGDEIAGSDFDDDNIDNYRDLDDDNDGIADVIEIGANAPDSNSNGTDDYQDTNSDLDAWSDEVEGVTTSSGTGITTITITAPNGSSDTVNLLNTSGGTVTGGTDSTTITITEVTDGNGTVTITGTPEEFDYQVTGYSD